MIDQRNMTLRSALVVLFVVYAYSTRNAFSESPEELVHLVAEQCRANHEMLNSFDAQFEITATRMTATGEFENIVDKTGRLAFNGQKLYLTEVFKAGGNVSVFVKSGYQARLAVTMYPQRVLVGPALNPKLQVDGDSRRMLVGSSTNPRLQKGTPDPWEIFDGGKCLHLDHLAPDEGTIVQAERKTVDGISIVSIVIEDPVPADAHARRTRTTLQFAADQNCMPIQMDVIEIGKEDQKDAFRAHGAYGTIQPNAVNGKTLFLPLSYHYEEFSGNKKTYYLAYNLKPETIKLNPSLPDDLFVIPSRPNDLVTNVDAPEGR